MCRDGGRRPWIGAAAARRARVAATPIPEAATAIRVDGELNDAIWQTRAGHYRIPSARPEGRRRADVRDGGAGRLRRHGALHRGPGVRPRAQTHRRHPHPARRRIPVGLDERDRRFVSRPAVGVRVRGQPGRRQAGQLLVQRQQQRSGMGRGVGRRASRAASAAGAPSSAFRSRSCGYRPSETSTFGLAIVRQVGRLNETTTWPLLAKSANGYVSSFGELTGLRLDRSPKRLEIVPYVSRRRRDAAGRARQSADRSARTRTARSAWI